MRVTRKARAVAVAGLSAVVVVVVAATVAWISESAALPSHSASPSASPSPKLAAKPFPRVNRPCQGKIPEPFAGVATSGDVAANVASFRRATGARLRVVEVYSRFPGAFGMAPARQIADLGVLPLIQLNPRHVSLAQVASGAYDGDIRSYAEQVRAFGC